MGNFHPQNTLSESFFVISERLVSIRAIVLTFTANKQTNTLNYIFMRVSHDSSNSVFVERASECSQG